MLRWNLILYNIAMLSAAAPSYIPLPNSTENVTVMMPGDPAIKTGQVPSNFDIFAATKALSNYETIPITSANPPANNPTHPPPVASPIPENPLGSGRASALLKNPNFNNTTFKNVVGQNVSSFDKLLNVVPSAQPSFNQLANNYNLIDPEVLQMTGTEVPSSEHLTDFIFDIIRMNYSVKNYVKNILRTISNYINIENYKIRTNVTQLGNIYKDLKDISHKLSHTKDVNLRSELLKEFFETHSSSHIIIESFSKRVEWLEKMKKDLANKL